MKKLTAFILALMMALSCTGALAEMDFSKGFKAEVSYELNPNMFTAIMMATMGSGNMEDVPPELMEAVIGLINQVTLTGAYDNETLQMSVNLKDTPIATLEGGSTADGGIAMVTNVLPSYALFVDAKTLDMLKAEMDNAMSQIDMEKIMAASEKFEKDVTKLMEESWQLVLAEDYVTEETGTYQMDDVVYTRKITINADSNELLRHLQGWMVQLVPMMETFFIESGLPVENMDFDDMKEIYSDDIPEEEAIPLYVTVYDMVKGNENNDCVYVTLEMADEEAVLAMVVAANGKQVECSLYFAEGNYATIDEVINAAYSTDKFGMVMDMAVLAGETEEEMSAMVSVVTSGIYMSYVIETKPVDNGLDAMYTLYVMSDEVPMMTARVSLRPLTEKLAPFSVEGKEMVNLMELAEGDRELEEKIAQDAKSGLSSLLITTITAAPEEIQALLSLAVDTETNDDFVYETETEIVP